MPVTLPQIDDRRFDALRGEALELAAAHVPEWTNFNRSDPGVTLVEVFAFLTENLLYRANQIPERNRKKFLQLLGIPLHAGASATGIVTFSTDVGVQEIQTGTELRSGQVPFFTTLGLDVLPLEAKPYYKR